MSGFSGAPNLTLEYHCIFVIDGSNELRRAVLANRNLLGMNVLQKFNVHILKNKVVTVDK